LLPCGYDNKRVRFRVRVRVRVKVSVRFRVKVRVRAVKEIRNLNPQDIRSCEL
jgi:hypothetical protein